MPYLAQRNMTVLGLQYTPGERVPVTSLPARSLRSLLSRGHLIEVETDELEADERARAGKRTRVAAGG